uniref:Uncharacterized protein n=1 Tax=Caenorhabditis japonica TaxID=281687 RepID=A0A8R1IRL5_CAEJA
MKDSLFCPQIRAQLYDSIVLPILIFGCTKGVYMLSAVTTSLNVTMVLTLRKFFSLLISFLVFENAFNMFHVIGAAFVFIGTFMFSVSFKSF